MVKKTGCVCLCGVHACMCEMTVYLCGVHACMCEMTVCLCGVHACMCEMTVCLCASLKREESDDRVFVSMPLLGDNGRTCDVYTEPVKSLDTNSFKGFLV